MWVVEYEIISLLSLYCSAWETLGICYKNYFCHMVWTATSIWIPSVSVVISNEVFFFFAWVREFLFFWTQFCKIGDWSTRVSVLVRIQFIWNSLNAVMKRWVIFPSKTSPLIDFRWRILMKMLSSENEERKYHTDYHSVYFIWKFDLLVTHDGGCWRYWNMMEGFGNGGLGLEVLFDRRLISSVLLK